MAHAHQHKACAKACGCQVKPKTAMLVADVFQSRMEPEYKMTQ